VSLQVSCHHDPLQWLPEAVRVVRVVTTTRSTQLELEGVFKFEFSLGLIVSPAFCGSDAVPLAVIVVSRGGSRDEARAVTARVSHSGWQEGPGPGGDSRAASDSESDSEEAACAAALARLVEISGALLRKSPLLWPPEVARLLGQVLQVGRRSVRTARARDSESASLNHLVGPGPSW
jgi:hypothetical protein